MTAHAPKNQYVIAVSGGVDSVVLLHLLTADPNMRLTVAHFDHGIRPDSNEDRKLVQALAQKYGVPFVFARGNLGSGASEAQARQARYNFLHEVRRASGARAIITAHHQDDVLETALLNWLRGTHRRGLSSLRSTDGVVRPLLQVPKHEIRRFAAANGLKWREDSTNTNDVYLRNYIRLHLLPRFSAADRAKLLFFIHQAARNNDELQTELGTYLHLQPGTHQLDRHSFIMLPHNVAREVMAEWLLLRAHVQLSKRLLERLVIAAKTAQAGSKIDVDGRYWLEILRDVLALRVRER